MPNHLLVGCPKQYIYILEFPLNIYVAPVGRKTRQCPV